MKRKYSARVAIVAALVVAAVTPTGTVQASPSDADYVVVLKDNVAAGRAVELAAMSLVRATGGQVGRVYGQVKGFSATLSENAVRLLKVNPLVEAVAADEAVSVEGTQLNPPSWGLDRISQRRLPLNDRYAYPNTGVGVTAYVIDSGVRTTHAQFGGRAVDGYDFVDNDAVSQDCNGHGTHVAGTVGGTDYGVAKEVKLVAVRALNCSGSGSISQIIAAIDWVAKNRSGPSVANLSIGAGKNAALNAAVKRLFASGVTTVVAAGNKNRNACSYSPSSEPTAVTVGAVDKTDRKASFSNYGKCLDIWAPGVAIVSTAKASDTASATMSGTSMASPHVAGAAALLLSAQPTLSPTQVRDKLVGNATIGELSGIRLFSPNKLLFVES